MTSKQIMTGLEGNRQIDLFVPRDSGSPPQEFLLTEAKPRSIGIPGEAIRNLKGQIDLPITRGTSHYLFYYTIMLLKGKK